MATVPFHLKEPKVDKPTAIFIWFNPQHGGPRVRLYTGDKIEPSLQAGGDVPRAIPRGRTLYPDAKRVNEALNANDERRSKRRLAKQLRLPLQQATDIAPAFLKHSYVLEFISPEKFTLTHEKYAKRFSSDKLRPNGRGCMEQVREAVRKTRGREQAGPALPDDGIEM